MPSVATVSQGGTQGMTLGRWWHELEQRGMILHTLGSSSLMPGWDWVSGVRCEPCLLC